jgi:hypothetical protein
MKTWIMKKWNKNEILYNISKKSSRMDKILGILTYLLISSIVLIVVGLFLDNILLTTLMFVCMWLFIVLMIVIGYKMQTHIVKNYSGNITVVEKENQEVDSGTLLFAMEKNYPNRMTVKGIMYCVYPIVLMTFMIIIGKGHVVGNMVRNDVIFVVIYIVGIYLIMRIPDEIQFKENVPIESYILEKTLNKKETVS